MNYLTKCFFAIVVATIQICSVQAQSVASLIEKCAPGQTVRMSETAILEGVVVSDYRSRNMELNPNRSYSMVDASINDCTVYLQSADGSRGVKIVFDDSSENRLMRYDNVKMDLKGCILIRHTDPDCLTISGVNAFNVMSVIPADKACVAVKEKYISELTDADLYTLVTLRDAEFIFKEGSYTNIWEPYSQFEKELHRHNYDVSGRMDGWASLLRDSQGSSMYMLVNTLCTWRRTDKQLPQGVGPLSGVLVHTPMRRYAGNMGRYSIRPLDQSDIAISRKNNSPWKRLTGWLLDGSAGASLEFELMGHQDNLRTEGKKGDRVLNDVGSTRGYFWTDCGAFIHVDGDYNALGTQNRGFVANGAILFKAPTVGWYKWDNADNMVGFNAFYTAFSTKKVSGTTLQVAFEWGAGNQDGNFSWNFPLEWKVEYAIDGGKFNLLKDAATGDSVVVLRTLPWWDNVIKDSGHTNRLFTPYDCGMGLQQHAFSLPAEAFGRQEVVVRISPASGLLSQIPSNPSDDVLLSTYVVRKNNKQTSIIRFGTVTVDYK